MKENLPSLKTGAIEVTDVRTSGVSPLTCDNLMLRPDIRKTAKRGRSNVRG